MSSSISRLILVWLVTAPLVAGVAGVAAGSKPTHSNRAVLEWNAIAAKAFLPTQGTDPLAQSRAFAILHAAIHDAVNAYPSQVRVLHGRTSHRPWRITGRRRGGGVAPRPRRIDTGPADSDRRCVHTHDLAGVADGPAKDAGITVGEASARATLARRERDGSDPASQPAYTPKAAAGDYQFTRPFDSAFFTGWGKVVPFGIEVAQHRLRGPYALASREVRRRCR